MYVDGPTTLFGMTSEWLHTYINTVHIYIHVLFILACIISYIKMMKERIIELFGVVN
jgi:hypothetical protein